jgi:hypothetical protein
MSGRLGRRLIVVLVALAAGLSGCAGGSPFPFVGPRPPVNDPDSDRLHRQAQAALARWADAVGAAGRQEGFVPVGEMTGQVGDWEESVGENNKIALMAGMVESTLNLSAEPPPDGQLRWQDGTTETVRLVSAQEALSEIRAAGTGSCTDCVPLQIASAELASGPVETSRGPATAPTWVFTIEGTVVHVTRVAIASRISAVPPPWDPNDAPVGISIESATGTIDGRQLEVAFTGAPAAGDEVCGADYSAEAVESPTAVVVIVTPHPHGIGESCHLVGRTRTAAVQLAAPLGERAVLEVKEGLPVSVVLSK